MTLDTCYKIGYILKPHGLKGAVTIALDGEAPADLKAVQTIFVLMQERLLPFFIEEISLKGDKAFLKLEEVNTPEEARDISKRAIYLPKSSRPKSGKGEFYDDEIIGFEVQDSTAGTLGKITGIVHAGPNKLLSLEFHGKEILIPLNSPFIDRIHKSGKKVTVTLPEGFLEI